MERVLASMTIAATFARPAQSGEEWVTITSSLRSDMTAAGQWSDRYSLPRSERWASGTGSI